jgi:hypothetical protein
MTDEEQQHVLADRVSVVRSGSTVALQLYVTIQPLAELIVKAVDEKGFEPEDELVVLAAFDGADVAMSFSRAVHTAAIAAQLAEDAS